MAGSLSRTVPFEYSCPDDRDDKRQFVVEQPLRPYRRLSEIAFECAVCGMSIPVHVRPETEVRRERSRLLLYFFAGPPVGAAAALFGYWAISPLINGDEEISSRLMAGGVAVSGFIGLMGALLLAGSAAGLFGFVVNRGKLDLPILKARASLRRPSDTSPVPRDQRDLAEHWLEPLPPAQKR